jgi:stage II sporulation protein D
VRIKSFYKLERVQQAMRMFKPLTLAIALSLVLPISLVTPLQSSALEIPSTFQITGNGYGHGVGMSQMGARSKALAGENAASILNYYYKDVTMEKVDDAKILRVNIGHQLTTARMLTRTQGANLQIFRGDIGDAQGVQPLATIPAMSSLNFSILGSTVIPSITTGKIVSSIPGNRIFTVRWSGTRYLAGADGVLTLSHATRKSNYRYGQVQIRAVKAGSLGFRLAITNSVRLADEYLWGVSEMPSFWPMAALEAQAIASRTFALSKAGTIRSACDCDLYGEISDQKFLGYAKEIEKKWGVFWKAAVTNTAGLVLTQSGLPITAWFGSSSGGITETALNAWGSERAFTHSVEDLASLDPTLNPNFYKWDRSITHSITAAAFLLPDVINLEILSRNPSGTVGMIRATASNGKQVSIRGETFRSRAKIPSAYFDLVGVQNTVEPTPSPSS